MKPRIKDKRRISLENVLSGDYIPFLSGRPKREKAIGENDILDLKIALHTTRSLDEFLKKV
jgi:hypothetical protein